MILDGDLGAAGHVLSGPGPREGGGQAPLDKMNKDLAGEGLKLARGLGVGTELLENPSLVRATFDFNIVCVAVARKHNILNGNEDEKSKL